MHSLLRCLLSLLLCVTARAQQPKLKPLSEIIPPAAELPGIWVEAKPGGDEYMTFNADGRLIITRMGHNKESFLWKCDTTAKPWKLDLIVKTKEGEGTVYSVFDFPGPGQFRFAAPAIDEAKRPGAEDLQKSTLILKRVPLEKHAGIHQAIQVHLKGLTGTWQGITNGSKGTATFSADGTYTISEGSDSDKGRYRIDVSKVPCKIDLHSTEGGGPSYGLYELKGDTLKVSRAKRRPEERPGDFDGAVEFVKKK